jgi:hypothetical protein
MTVVRFRERQPHYGISLFKDLRKTLRIEPPIIDTINSDVYVLPATLPGMRISAIYEFSGGVWVKLTNYAVTRRRVRFSTTINNQIMIVPSSFVSLLQSSLRPSEPVRVFCKETFGYTIKNLSITSYNYETAAVGPYLFSETIDGSFVDTLNPSTVPPYFYVKSSLVSKGIEHKIPLVITADVYL